MTPFRSLAGRMFLLLTLALLCAQGISFALYLADRHDMIRSMTEDLLLARLPPALEAMEGLPARRQALVAEALSSRWSHYSIAEDPGAAGRDGSLQAGLSEALGLPSRAVRVGPVDRGESRYLAQYPHHDDVKRVLQVSAQLSDGRWLIVERPLDISAGRMFNRVILSLVLSVAAVLVVVALVARRITQPLAALSDAADRFGRGEQVPELEERGPEDVARTVRAFNLMSERLRRFVTDRTQMLAAISHDLRTPITALRIRAEMLDNDDDRDRINESLAEMEHMVEATLNFARADSATEPTERLDLTELAGRVCRELDPEGGRVRVSTASAPIAVGGRPTALRRAVRNVLDNALRYGGAATVDVGRDAGACFVRISDEGPGIATEDQERVFEPFVRLETSRSTETGGSGLGLAIARTIVRAHGGDVRLENRRPHGLNVTIELPCAGV